MDVMLIEDSRNASADFVEVGVVVHLSDDIPRLFVELVGTLASGTRWYIVMDTMSVSDAKATARACRGGHRWGVAYGVRP